MFECNCQSRALPNIILKPFWYLSVFALIQAPSIMAGDLANTPTEAKVGYITVAKSWEIRENCDGPISQAVPLETTIAELKNHDIPFTWARKADPQGGLINTGCSNAPGYDTRLWLNAFEIAADKLDQARALGFKTWSEWPNAIFTYSKWSWSLPPYVAKSTGPLKCDDLGRPLLNNRFDDSLMNHPESMGYELVRAGIPVDYMFCAIRPDYPPQGVCGQDSGKLDVFKIPESSIPRALALGFQLAGVGVEGGIGAIKPIPCNNLPNADTTPCTAAPELAVNAPATVNTTPATLVYDISLTGNLKDRAKLRTALGKAVTQGILATYTTSSAEQSQFSACVEPANNVSQKQLGDFVKSIKKIKIKPTGKLSVLERTGVCGSVTP